MPDRVVRMVAASIAVMLGTVAIGAVPASEGDVVASGGVGLGTAGLVGASYSNIPQLARAEAKWQISAEPSIWYVAPSGDLRLPQTGAGAIKATPVMVRELNNDSPRVSPFAEVNLTKGRSGITLRGFAFAASGRAYRSNITGTIGDIDFNAGDRLASSLDFASFEAEYHYRFEWTTSDPTKLRPSIDLVGGARLYWVDWKVEQIAPAGIASSADELFAEPFIGFKGRVDFGEKFTIDLQNTFGYSPLDQSVASWDVMVGFQWRPLHNLGVQIGYRQLLFRMDTGDGAADFEYDGALAGLYAGLVFKF